MSKLLPIFTLVSGIMGICLVVLLGLFQWRILWLAQHDAMLMDWNPYTTYLRLALNWWVPFSLCEVVASIAMSYRLPHPARLLVGGGLHLFAAVWLVGLGLWVFTGPLEGVQGAWWMWWNG